MAILNKGLNDAEKCVGFALIQFYKKQKHPTKSQLVILIISLIINSSSNEWSQTSLTSDFTTEINICSRQILILAFYWFWKLSAELCFESSVKEQLKNYTNSRANYIGFQNTLVKFTFLNSLASFQCLTLKCWTKIRGSSLHSASQSFKTLILYICPLFFPPLKLNIYTYLYIFLN